MHTINRVWRPATHGAAARNYSVSVSPVNAVLQNGPGREQTLAPANIAGQCMGVIKHNAVNVSLKFGLHGSKWRCSVVVCTGAVS